MSSFTLHPIPTIAAPNEVVELGVNGRRPLNDFTESMKKSGSKKELIRLQTLLSEIALGRPLPPKAFKKLRDQDPDDTWEEFEIVVGRYRFYLFYEPPNRRIVVLGELKKNVKGNDNKEQRRNIKHLRALKKAYRDSVQTTKTEEE